MGKEEVAVDYGKLSDEARELVLWSENDETVYRQDLAIQKNLDAKIKRGTFDAQKAVKLFAYEAEHAAKRYAKEFGGTWHKMFSTAARHEAAEFMRDAFVAERRGRMTQHTRTR